MKALEFVIGNGTALALGASLLLAAGCVAALLFHAPVERRRIGVITAAGLLLYTVVALVPLPRWSLPQQQQAIAVTETVGPPLPPALLAADLASAPRLASGLEPRRRAAGAQVVALPPPQPAAPLPIGLLLAIAFLAGGVAEALWLLVGYARLRALLHHSQPAPAWLQHGSSVPVRLTDRYTRPFCTGALWPVVVLPQDLAVPARANAARAVLAHELAHVRAGDCKAQLLFALLLPLFYWQPLFWWLRAQVRFCSELLADDAAAQQVSVRGYARELLEVVAAGHARVAHAGALSIFHRPSEFSRRIQMLLRREVPLSHSVSLRHRLASAASVLLMVAVTAGFCGVSRAQEPQNAEALLQEAAQLRQMVRELKAEVGKLQQRLAAQPQMSITPPPAYTTVPVLVEFQDLGELGATSGVQAQPLAVPVLQDIPIVGNLFQNRTRTYKVHAGDSLQSIAKKHGAGASPDDIAQANPGLDPRRLRAGQEIVLPAAKPASETTTGGADVFGYTSRPQADPVAGQPSQPETTATDTAAAAPAAHGEQHSIADRSLSDLLNVVTRCIELRGQVEIAEAECAQLSALAQKGLTDAQGLRTAGIKLRTQKQQLGVTERLLKGELANAKAELQRLEQLQKAGLLPAGDSRIGTVGNFVQVLMGSF